MDETVLGLWNGWSMLALALLGFVMAEIGNVCSRKGKTHWQPVLMFVAGVLVTIIFMHSGWITLALSIPIALILAMLISIVLVPQWSVEEASSEGSHARTVSSSSSRDNRMQAG